MFSFFSIFSSNKDGYNSSLPKELEKEYSLLIERLEEFLDMLDIINNYMVKEHFNEFKEEFLAYLMRIDFELLKYLFKYYEDNEEITNRLKDNQSQMKDMQQDILKIISKSLSQDLEDRDKITININSIIFILKHKMQLKDEKLFSLYKK
ncbi:hypothetical protein MNB_SV-15-451 [hydrothermal vent metagenome]|uniref:Uncharacterized protein n=1 Tax=hydrothermal vent metagenome TaxID=652676 RepID=A0A1W1EJ26_9ZZZZ